MKERHFLKFDTLLSHLGALKSVSDFFVVSPGESRARDLRPLLLLPLFFVRPGGVWGSRGVAGAEGV